MGEASAWYNRAELDALRDEIASYDDKHGCTCGLSESEDFTVDPSCRAHGVAVRTTEEDSTGGPMMPRLRFLVAVGIPLAVVGVVLSLWPRRVAEYGDEHLYDWRRAA